jgi:large subunit ribosomal protein L37e
MHFEFLMINCFKTKIKLLYLLSIFFRQRYGKYNQTLFDRPIQTRGTPAAGKKHTHSHAISRVSGKSNFHLQKRKCASLGGGTKKRRYSWSVKAIRRNRTGTGRMRSLRHVHRREKNGYRHGTQASKNKASN